MSRDNPAPALPDEDHAGSSRVGLRPDEPTLPRNGDPCLVVGVNRHASSHVALDTAAMLAARLGARLKVVHVVDLSDFPIDPDSADWDTAAAATLKEQRRQVTRQLALFTGTWTFHIRRGEPARVLSDMADECNAVMVVIGAGQDSSLAALVRSFGGSVARSLIGHHRRRPVLVVPTGSPENGGPNGLGGRDRPPVNTTSLPEQQA